MPFSVRPTSLLRAGLSGTIERFANDQLAGKLLDIGVRPGSRLRVIRRAPFGGGWYVKIDRHCLALRGEELACILIK